MTAWVVRAGSQGENERCNLTEGFATVGWTEVGDLSSCTSPQEMRAAVDDAYATDPVRRRINSAGQLWAFRGGIQADDLIVMPSKTQPGYLWFGTATGDYVYAPGEPDPTRRHRVPVQWHDSPVSKTVVEQDLVYTLNGMLTVFRPSRNDAARRLLAIATTGRPPRGPLRLRWPCWSAGSGMTALIRRARRWVRIAREEYALSPSTASGRVRGRPAGRATRSCPSRGNIIGESPAWPAVIKLTSGIPAPSTS